MSSNRARFQEVVKWNIAAIRGRRHGCENVSSKVLEVVKQRLEIPSGRKAGSYPKALESSGSEEGEPQGAVTKALRHFLNSQDPRPLMVLVSPTLGKG